MSMWRTLTFLALLVVTSQGRAQEIVVRSGAHDSFSRLVLRIPRDREWSLENTGNSARFMLAGHRSGFDTSRVFTFIDRRHVQEIIARADGFDIAFACDCVATSFVERNEFVVIDIAKRPSSRPAFRFGTTASPIWPSSDVRLTFPPEPQSVQTPELAPEQPTERLAELSEVPEARDIVGSLNNLVTPEGRSDTKSATQLAEAQEKLAQRVAIAATRGVLDPTQRPIELPFDTDRPQINTEIFDSSDEEPEADTTSEEPNALNLRITSSSDVPTRVLAPELEATSMGVRCIAPEMTAVEQWGTERTPMQQIAEYRALLFTEFDRLDEEVAVDLAKLYLHYGFGAEAQQVLSIEPSLARRNPALMEIAETMEYGHTRDGAYLKHFADCASSAALWAILAQETLDPAVPIDADAALRAATALPMHLRRFVAPKLSRRLLEYGDAIRAETALRSVDRTPEPATAQSEMARAELQMSKGETEAAQQTLSDIVTSNEQQSAEALIKFVDSHLEADTQIDESVATLVEAYDVEMRGDPLGAELKRTHVLALAKSGQFDAAFRALTRMKSRNGPETDNELRALLLDIVTRSANNIVFLEKAFAHSQNAVKLGKPRVAFAMAKRAAELGFPQLADLILQGEPDIPMSTKARELKARISLDLGRPPEAEAQLFGLESDAADRLRARAKTMENSHAEAIGLYDRLGEQDQSVRAAWLAEDWSRLGNEDASLFAPVAELIEAPMDASDDRDGMLGRLSDAVSESQQARAVIQSLFQGAVGAAPVDEQ